jgi:transposase
MMIVRKTHTTQFKTKVALEAIREQKTVNELTAEYGVHATQINTWKKQILSAIPDVFPRKNNKVEQDQQGLVDELYRQIGQLTVERDWLKKNAGLSLRR